MPQLTILNADCRDILDRLDANSIDAIITDPPYHLTTGVTRQKGFMEQRWDGGDIAFDKTLWRQAFRVAKPGSHHFIFGHPRTVHKVSYAIEQAGFEIKDMIIWRFNQSMPTSCDISKNIDKYYKADRQVIDYGYRGNGRQFAHGHSGFRSGIIEITEPATDIARQWEGWRNKLRPGYEPVVVARKPVKNSLTENILKFNCGGLNLSAWRYTSGNDINVISCPKPSKKERHAGCDGISRIVEHNGSRILTSKCSNCGKRFLGTEAQRCNCPVGSKKSPEFIEERGNSHPTVKPISLLQSLAELAMTPNQTCLDIFGGSGSTAIACLNIGFNCIFVEKDPYYFKIAEARIAYAKKTLNFVKRTAPELKTTL